MVRSSFNIQYQSTGIGSLSSLREIELRRNVQGLFLALRALFDGRERLIFFSEISMLPMFHFLPS